MKIYDWFVNQFIGRIEWSSLKYFFTGRYYNLTSDDVRSALAKLSTGRYIILIRRNTHFTTYLIGTAHLLATLIWPTKYRKAHMGFWSHACLHLEDESLREIDLQIIEAVGQGVKISEFWDVLNCDSICLLKPKNYSEDEFEKVIAWARTLIGRPYDNVFNIKDDKEISCVEAAYSSLLAADPKGLPSLSEWVDRVNNLTPDMIYECGDFDVELEIRR